MKKAKKHVESGMENYMQSFSHKVAKREEGERRGGAHDVIFTAFMG